MPTTEEEEGIWPMLDFAVELHREFAEDQSDRQPATNEEDPLFFSWAANGTCACGGNAEQRSRGRKEGSERGRGLAIPLIGILGSGCSYNSEGQQESTRSLHQFERVQSERLMKN